MSQAAFLPLSDIWVKAFNRQDPDLGVVHRLGQAIRAREIRVVGLVRQEVLVRARDRRQFARLQAALAAFPDVRILPDDHVASAGLVLRLRDQGHSLGLRQALVWAVAVRTGLRLWSTERSWVAFARWGCPVGMPGGPGTHAPVI